VANRKKWNPPSTESVWRRSQMKRAINKRLHREKNTRGREAKSKGQRKRTSPTGSEGGWGCGGGGGGGGVGGGGGGVGGGGWGKGTGWSEGVSVLIRSGAATRP